jgi:hypothetical protein
MPTDERPQHVHPESVPEGSGFDALVKGMATGTISRGRILKLAGSALLGAMFSVPWVSKTASALEGCTTCPITDTGRCSTINPDSPRPFQPCCEDTATTTTPGTLVPSTCSCFETRQQDRAGRIRPGTVCLPPDQNCRRLERCTRRRDYKCPSGGRCVLGTCCTTPEEFSQGIGVCAQVGDCDPVQVGGESVSSSSSRRGATLTRPS